MLFFELQRSEELSGNRRKKNRDVTVGELENCGKIAKQF